MAFEDKLFYPFPPSAAVPAFKFSTLIFPSVSIGNVPQLAVDLLITTLHVPLVGYMHSPYLLPCAGSKEGSGTFGPGGISCPLEVYFDSERKLTIIQQRSPFISHKMKTPFVQELWNFTSCFGFSKIIMLASSDAALRTDEQINGPRLQVLHVHDPDPNAQSDLSEKLAKLTLSTPSELTATPTASIQGPSGETKEKRFPASGYLRNFLRMAEDDKYSKREVTALVMFAAEGDNSEDAKEMAAIVAKSVDVEISEWKTPKSWEGLFGENVRKGAEEGLFW